MSFLNVKNKRSQGYNDINEILPYENKLKYKNIYFCLSKDSTVKNRNGITINKDNKKYYLMKDKWFKLKDNYTDPKPDEYFRVYLSFPTTTITYLPPEKRYFDFEGIEATRDLLAGCKYLIEGPLEYKNYSQIKNMRGWFYNVTTLEKFYPIDTTNVENISCFFNNCNNLYNIDFTFNLPYVNNTDSMFNSSGLKEIRFSNFAINTTSKVQSHYMFHNTINLENIVGLNTNKIESMTQMFYNCFNLKSLSFDIDMMNCTDCTNMFTNCPSENIVLKNVPNSLDLTNIGTTNYTIINRI